MSELKQEQLMTYIDAAFTFYECINKGRLPTVKQTQKLLEVAGIHETLERIKVCGDIVRELNQGEEE